MVNKILAIKTLKLIQESCLKHCIKNNNYTTGREIFMHQDLTFIRNSNTPFIQKWKSVIWAVFKSMCLAVFQY